jgi:aminoglycoside 6'-N-acetyltransferase I
MDIIDLYDDADMIEQVATLLLQGFAGSWPDMESAIHEVRESLASERISRVAIDDDETVLGWIAGESAYEGHVWELHPLVVHSAYQGQGIGQQLVADFEEQVKACDGITIYLGTDDEHNHTSLGGVDVYPNVLEHLTNIRNLHRHPYEFYQKLGYTIVGIIPDANGFGKPDICMAKRVQTMT